MALMTFDPKIFNDHLHLCIEQPGLDMDNYILAYKQLSKFFLTLGTVFSFITKDVDEKIDILETFRQSPQRDEYQTIKGMLDHERTINFHTSTSPPSGSRTFLRLHRALEFTYLFMKELASNSTDSISTTAKECYNKTLAKYHPWIIRNGAYLAFYALPNKNDLIKSLWGENDIVNGADEIGRAAEKSKQIFEICQHYLEERDMLDLP